MKTLRRWFAAGALAFVPAVTCASYHTFQIETIYSNADGTIQFVVLHETQNSNGEHLLTGHAFTSTHGPATKSFTFLGNLPSSATADKRVLIATQGFAALGLVTPDYVIPNQFVPTDGGILSYAVVDQIAYGPLPTDGVNAINRTGTSTPNVATNFAGTTAMVPALPVTVVEYYNLSLDHFFISALEPDIDALDSGRIPGWTRTPQTFQVFPSQAAGGAGVNPVCRFYIPPAHGNSHFFSADPAECAAIQQRTLTDPNYSGYVYESPNVFYIALPNTTSGACPAATMPVYRLWNNRVDSNHRYTASLAVKSQMIGFGFIAEGYGPDAVIMCASIPAAIAGTSGLNLNGDLWCGTQFVAVAGKMGVGGYIFTSPDGITWTWRTTGTPGLRGVACDGARIALVGAFGAALGSPDGGVTWTLADTGTQQNLNWVAWSGTLLVAVGTNGAIVTSADGKAWTPRGSGTTEELYGAVWSGTQFVVTGTNGAILTSPDGITWTARNSGTIEHLLDAKWTGTTFIVPGSGGTILTSPDGVTWTRQMTGTQVGLHGVTWSGTQFVVVGANGHIRTSPDGVTWTARTSGTTSSLADVAWSGAQFAAVGVDGTIVSSPDGVTWTLR